MFKNDEFERKFNTMNQFNSLMKNYGVKYWIIVFAAIESLVVSNHQQKNSDCATQNIIIVDGELKVQ